MTDALEQFCRKQGYSFAVEFEIDGDKLPYHVIIHDPQSGQSCYGDGAAYDEAIPAAIQQMVETLGVQS